MSDFKTFCEVIAYKPSGHTLYHMREAEAGDRGRFKKWRDRPGCDGAFRLFLLNDRDRVQGAGCVVRGDARLLSDLSDPSDLSDLSDPSQKGKKGNLGVFRLLRLIFQTIEISFS
jgi:hypothetical protein